MALSLSLLGLLLQFVVRVATASLLIAWNCCWTLLEDAEMLSGDPLWKLYAPRRGKMCETTTKKTTTKECQTAKKVNHKAHNDVNK